jgi:hypothetical protein
VRLVLTYAKNVRSEARWSRATLPEFSNRNSTQFCILKNDFDIRGRLGCGFMPCKFGESELVLSQDSDPLSADDDNSVSAEKDRL